MAQADEKAFDVAGVDVVQSPVAQHREDVVLQVAAVLEGPLRGQALAT